MTARFAPIAALGSWAPLLGLLALAGAALSGCSPEQRGEAVESRVYFSLTPAPVPSSVPIADPWLKKWWVAKLVNVLSDGRKALSVAEIEKLAELPEDEVVDRLLADPLFGEAALRFNLFLLGQNRDDLREGNGVFKQQPLVTAPSAYQAAIEIASGGPAYLEKLFAYQQPYYMAPIPSVFDGKPTPAEVADLRAKAYDAVLARLEALRAELAPQSPQWPADFCGKLNGILQTGDFPQSKFLPHVLRNDIGGSFDWFGKLLGRCASGFTPQAKPYPQLLPELDALIARLRALFSRLAAYEPATYLPRSLSELKALEVADLGVDFRFFNIRMSVDLANSATNMNRKRGAYLLKQFFCDDLTPVALELPASHAGQGQHGSDPSCMACHYKLDPMAGFFRNLGAGFRDYSALGQISFDGGASLERASYVANWAAPAGSAHGAWDVGYVRSSQDESANTYGESMDDLFRILRTEPEVKKCMVRRMFEHFVSPRMLVDEAYIQALAEEFAEKSKADSSAAFRGTIARLVKSSAFKSPNPDPDRCYDRPEGFDPSTSPPCAIAYIVEKNCVKCHKDTKRNIDLSKWQKLPDGNLGFLHLDDNGATRSRAESFKLIMERITDPDPDERMPLNRVMPDSERETLFQWLEKNS